MNGIKIGSFVDHSCWDQRIVMDPIKDYNAYAKLNSSTKVETWNTYTYLRSYAHHNVETLSSYIIKETFANPTILN